MIRRFLQHVWRRVIDRLPEGTVLSILSGPLRGYPWVLSHHGYYWKGVVDEGTGVRDYGYISGRYERETQQTMVKWVKPGTWVWDLGAHHGFFTLLAWALGARGVVAFEGDEKSVECIQRNCPTAKIHPMYVNAQTRWEIWPKPDFVKCDIDGGESEALLGLLRVYKPRIILLFTHGPLHEMFCRGLLEENGYTLTILQPDDATLAVLQ